MVILDSRSPSGGRAQLIKSEVISHFASVQSNSVALEGSCQSLVYTSVMEQKVIIVFFLSINSKLCEVGMLKIGLFQGNTTARVGLSLKRFQTDHLPPTSSSHSVYVLV